MKTLSLALAIAIALTSVSLCPVATGTLISLSGGSISQMTVRGTDSVTNFTFGPVDPLPQVGTISLSGTNATASADYNYSDNGFVIGNLQYSLSPGAFAELATTYRMIPNVDLNYTVTGSLNWSGARGTPTLFVQIQDISGGDPGPNITNQFFSKSGTSNTTLSVVNSVANPLTGVLSAGHTYKLSFDIGADTPNTNSTVGIAAGGASITWTGVPEPATWSLLAIGAAATAWMGRQRPRKIVH
jgi:hypothetical protein